MLGLVLFNIFIKDLEYGINGMLIEMPNDTKFTGLQSVQISNCEEKENWPKYNKDLNMSRKKN